MEPEKADRSQQSQKPGEKPEARGQKPEKPSLGARSPRKTPKTTKNTPGGGKKKTLRVHRGVPGEGLRKKGYFSIRPPSWPPPLPRSWSPPPPLLFLLPGAVQLLFGACCWGCVVVVVAPALSCRKNLQSQPALAETLQKGGWGGGSERAFRPL